ERAVRVAVPRARSDGGAGDLETLLGKPENGVDLLSVDLDLEVQVRPGGEAERAHAGDLLAGHHTVALVDVQGLHVAVGGQHPVIGQDADPVAEPLRGAGVDDGAVGGGEDRGADGVGDVDATVETAPAHREGGGERAGRRGHDLR